MGHDLERTRPVDVTGDTDPLSLADDVRISEGGAAMQMFGRPFNELTRSEQVMVGQIISGRRREIEENLRAMKLNNALTAQQRIARTASARDKLAELLDMAIQDAADLVSGDNLGVNEVDGGFRKNVAGSKRRNIRHLKHVTQILKTHTETEVMLAKLEEKAAPTFIKEDKRQVVIATPEDVRARLGRFAKGAGDGCAGGGDVFDADAEAED